MPEDEIIKIRRSELDELLEEKKEEIRKELSEEIYGEKQSPDTKKSGSESMSRRDFLKKAGMGAIGIGALGMAPAASQLKLTKNGISSPGGFDLSGTTSVKGSLDLGQNSINNVGKVDTNSIKFGTNLVGGEENWKKLGEKSDSAEVVFSNLEKNIAYSFVIYGNSTNGVTMWIDNDGASGKWHYWDETGSKHTSQDKVNLIDTSGWTRLAGEIKVSHWGAVGFDNQFRPGQAHYVNGWAQKGGTDNNYDFNSIHFGNPGDGDITIEQWKVPQ